MEQTNGLVPRPRSVLFEAHGKVINFEIILDRRDGPNCIGVYSPGDQLKGYVRLELSQRLTVSNIDLLVQGTGNVTWKQRGPQGEAVVTDDEVYLNDIAELVGKRRNEMVTLSAGEHIFPFACELPFELPATFTGSHGYVSYLVKVVIQADRNEPAHREPCLATSIFLLESRLSMEGLSDQLNAFRIDYKHPVKTSGLSSGSSAVRVSLFMPRRAYDIGDTIVINMSLTNTSKRAVKIMSMGLVMEATYKTHGKAATERLLVADHEDEFIVRHLESRQWRHVGLTVPRYIPPSGLPHSTIIGIKYLLVFKADLERSQESLMIETPVLIGLELPDEMKLSAAALESNFAADDSASARLSNLRPIYQGTSEPSLSSSVPPQSPAASDALQRPLYIDVQKVGRLQQPKQQQMRQPQMSLVQQPTQPQYQAQVRYQPQQPQPQPQQLSPRADSDTQVISMRFTDELDDHSPYGQPYNLQQHQHQHQGQHYHQSKVSRNPLFVSDVDGANGHQNGGGASDHRFEGDSNDRTFAALDASLGNGAEEVLY